MNYAIKQIKSNWTTFELTWITIATSLILYLSFLWDDTLLGTISSLAGIISVVLCAKGKINYLYFGIIQCTTYIYITYQYQLYGEMMLNLLVFLPFNIITIFVWRKNRKQKDKVVNGEEIATRKLTKKQWIIFTPILIVTSLLYAWLLSSIGARQVGLDSFAVVLSVFAQILLTLRYVENWLIWNIVNVLTVMLWAFTLIETGGNDYGILVMQIAFLVNSLYAYWNWTKITKE